MKVKDITIDTCKEYLRIDKDYKDEDMQMQLFLDGAKRYAYKYTGVVETEFPSYDIYGEEEGVFLEDDCAIGILILFSNYYEKRTLLIDEKTLAIVNFIFDMSKRYSV